MKNTLIAGIALIVIGAVLLGFDYHYTTREQVLKIGPISATAEREHVASFPPILGWLLVGGGICVVVFGFTSKKN
jgi:hypothetical protein